jgi:NAD(P)-dependent dehydrogenase (short-subunit alcohol dehydrogenase family)
MTVDFNGQVVLVTGAGRGLGRTYGEHLAQLGASLVINDFSPERADEAVAAITAAGGSAVASHDSVSSPEGAAAIVATAVDRFGTVDAVINNAGTMRNAYFEDLSAADLRDQLDTHVMGSFLVTQAAWPVMRARGYGRVVMTSSSGGMFAMAGESNYAAAKGGVYGLMKGLAFEGAEHGIRVNAILPMASTLIAVDRPVPDYEKHYPAEIADALKPRRTTDAVAPMVAYLASRECAVTSEAFHAGFGRYARVFVGETHGWLRDEDGAEVTPDDIAAHLDEIRDRSEYAVPSSIFDEVRYIAEVLGLP